MCARGPSCRDRPWRSTPPARRCGDPCPAASSRRAARSRLRSMRRAQPSAFSSSSRAAMPSRYCHTSRLRSVLVVRGRSSLCFQQGLEVGRAEESPQAGHLAAHELVRHGGEAAGERDEMVHVVGPPEVADDLGEVAEHDVVVVRLGVQEATCSCRRAGRSRSFRPAGRGPSWPGRPAARAAAAGRPIGEPVGSGSRPRSDRAAACASAPPDRPGPSPRRASLTTSARVEDADLPLDQDGRRRPRVM